jgi:hypothetical protein
MKAEATHYVYPIYNREGKLIYGSFNTTKECALYEARKDYWYEDITETQKLSFVRGRQTPVILDSERDFILNALSIEGNFGNNQDRNKVPQCMLEVSRDGGYSYGATIVRNLPNTGNYHKRVMWNGLGLVRNCVIKWSTSSPIDVLLQNASITIVSLGFRL